MGFLLPPLEVNNVANYNENGAALVRLLEERHIDRMHHSFALGMFAVYAMLVQMRWFTETEISWAPHANFDSQAWLDIRFAPEVVALLALIPYPKGEYDHDDRKDIAPNAVYQSYLWEASMNFRDPTYNEFPIPPQQFSVTGGDGEKFGNYYIYDTSSGNMLIWNLFKGVGAEEYEKNSEFFRPAEVVMTNWINNLYNLIYIPFFRDCGHKRMSKKLGPLGEPSLGPEDMIADPIADPYTGSPRPMDIDPYLSIDAWINDRSRHGNGWSGNGGLVNNINQRTAVCDLFQRHGWPESFDGDKFAAEFSRFEARIEELDHEIFEAPDRGDDKAARKAKEEFLADAAGRFAIRDRGAPVNTVPDWRDRLQSLLLEHQTPLTGRRR